jgi:hypothetical protein
MGSEVNFDTAYRASLRQYELGRLRVSVQRAAMVCILVAGAATFLFGKVALVWIPITLVSLTFTEWRGSLLMQGARRGLLAGLASLLLPLSILRPCCGVDAKAMGVSCCVMPSACWVTGTVVGLAMTLFLPKAPRRKRKQAALGLILGVTSVAVLRCSMLFLGEAVGLLGGIAAGVIATSAARAWLSRVRSGT